jgi:hypothetical protein
MRLVAVELRGSNEAHDCGRTLTSAERTCKQPVVAPDGPRANLVFNPVVVVRHAPIVEIARERLPAFEAVIQRFRYCGALGDELAMRDQPFVKRVTDGLRPKLS